MKRKTLSWLSVAITIMAIVGAISAYFINKSKTTTLTIGVYTGSSWDVPNNQQYHMINYAVRKFERQHPNVKIKYESGIRKSDYLNWLSEKVVKGQTPDVIMMPQENFNLFASERVFKDLSPYVKRDQLTHRFYTSALASGQYEGRQYTLPYETNPTLLLANRNLVKKSNLTKLNNVNYFRSFCHQISSQPHHYGVTSTYEWSEALLATNAQLFSGPNHELSLTNPRARRGFNLIESLNSNSPIHNVTEQMFDQGKVALMPLTFAKYRTYTTYPYYVTQGANFQIKALKMPGNHSTPASTVGFGINRSCQDPELAWQFLKLVCANKQTQQELMKTDMGCSVMPSVVKSKETAQLLQKENSTKNSITVKTLDKIVRDEVVMPKFKNYNQIFDRLDYQIQQALDNGTLEDQLFDIQTNINRQIE